MWSKGRLGNQLFQLNALEAARKPNEPLILLGFGEIPKSFLPKRSIRIIRSARWTKKRLNCLERFARFAASAKIFRSSMLGSEGFHSSWGLLPVKIFLDDWFTSSPRINASRTDFVLRLASSALVAKQKFFLRHPHLEGRALCFVHVRRGDFLSVPVEAPFALPTAWYLDQMDHLEIGEPDIIFLLFSDDKRHIEKHFSVRKNVCLVDEILFNEFLLMASCELGILSCSTFSWWGARIANTNGGKSFIAPSGWTNWRGERGVSEEIPSSFLEYHPVAANN